MEDVLLGRRRIGFAQRAGACAPAWPRPGLPRAHATDLLIAFRQDATKLRYATIDELYELLPLFGGTGRPLRARPAWRRSRLLLAVRRAVHVVADPEPYAGLRERSCGTGSLLSAAGSAGPFRRLGGRFAPARPRRRRLRRVFVTLLDRVDRMNQAASELPEIVRESSACGSKPAIIHGLAKRLARRLVHNDPLATPREAATGRRGLQRPVRRVLSWYDHARPGRFAELHAARRRPRGSGRGRNDRARGRHFVLPWHARASAGPPPRDVCDLCLLPDRR